MQPKCSCGCDTFMDTPSHDGRGTVVCVNCGKHYIVQEIRRPSNVKVAGVTLTKVVGYNLKEAVHD